ncbi:cyclic nucleotide-gated ion channel [Musa troglodytarum]|uniref:Cyclic nucleotide-gated ion channel n=1 Tax=Musa troglodytarum TaxID=320322 RepID=A0A9E7E7X4_9LILI|nr:cyclic nucleotide-gated ion channel [Musa troglodytarum]
MSLRSVLYSSLAFSPPLLLPSSSFSLPPPPHLFLLPSATLPSLTPPFPLSPSNKRHHRRKENIQGRRLKYTGPVPMFEQMNDQLMDALCDRLKPDLYTENSCIIREGDPVDVMLHHERKIA